jgi:flagellar motor protein MotB
MPAVATAPPPPASAPGVVSATPPTAYTGGPLQVAVIQFGQGSAGLRGEDMAVIRDVARIHRRNGGVVRIYAHASHDVLASSVHRLKTGNLDVSVKRGTSIVNALIRAGVPRDAIVMEALSDEEPIYTTATARGIAANRRAEIFFDF